MKYYITIDKRERDLLNLIKTIPEYKDSNGNIIEWRDEHLTIGDFIIFCETKAIMVIERKTWNDLAASIKDGRIENIKKLIQYRDQTGAKIGYLIEGQAFPTPKTKFARIPYLNLRAHLDHLIMRDNVIEIRTPNLIGTIERLYQLIKNISSIKEKKYYTSGNIESKDDLALAKINFQQTDVEIIQKIWSSVPGINFNNCKLFMKYHISELILGKLTKEQISEFKYSNGKKIGMVRAKKICYIANSKLKNNNKNYIKILSSIPRISKQSAEIILAKYPIHDILNKWQITKDSIEKLNRGKTTIGKKIVENLEKYLIQSNIIIEEEKDIEIKNEINITN